MKLEELIMIIETYGGDIRRWPEEKRIEAEKLLLASTEAQSILSEARKLDTLLDRYVVTEADDRLTRKIVNDNTQTRNSGIMAYLLNPFLNPSLAFAVLVICLLFGFMVGFLDGSSLVQQPTPADSATLLLGPVEIGVI
ncbi:MAG TPA: hypothetical protein VHT73_02415 [Thermodesulfobacteriota bacterium]|nr:hypothetical protein [Thermodesulfobacteriota bacterium]